MRRQTVEHRFVEFIPEDLEEGVVYVSITYATVVHRCLCGCGGEVVTPIDPHRWSLNFDGASISLAPSIGNWSFACQSHYWIERNCVDWSRRWTRDEIADGRAFDRAAVQHPAKLPSDSPTAGARPPVQPASIWRRMLRTLGVRGGRDSGRERASRDVANPTGVTQSGTENS